MVVGNRSVGAGGCKFAKVYMCRTLIQIVSVSDQQPLRISLHVTLTIDVLFL